MDRQPVRDFLTRSSQAIACGSSPISSTSFSPIACRPVNTRPSSTAANWGVGEPAAVFYEAFEPAVAVGHKRCEGGANLVALVGSKPLGSAYERAEDFTVSIFTPTLSRRPETSDFETAHRWNRPAHCRARRCDPRRSRRYRRQRRPGYRQPRRSAFSPRAAARR